MRLRLLLTVLPLLMCEDANKAPSPSSSKTDQIDFKSNSIKGQVTALKYCGESMIVLTDANRLYRSIDTGRSWKAMRNTIRDLGEETIEYDDEKVGEVKDIIVSPVDENILIFVGTHEVNWKTENCGGDVVAMN